MDLVCLICCTVILLIIYVFILRRIKVELYPFFSDLAGSYRTSDVDVICCGAGRDLHVSCELAPLSLIKYYSCTTHARRL
jgi:hypothetical protein